MQPNVRRHSLLLPGFLSLLGLLLLFAVSGLAAETIKVGAIFAQSGKAKHSNQPAILGVQLAVEEINGNGGILGLPLELLLFDNESTPIGSHLAAEKAAMAGVAAIIGASWSSHSLAVAKVAQARNIPMISPISTVPSLTATGDHVFRVCYSDDLQGSILAHFAYHELQARSALIFVDIASDFSIIIANIFKTHFAALGGTVAREMEYKTGQSDYSDEIDQALAEDTDVIFLSGYDESGFIAAKLQEAGSRAIPIGSDGWDADSFYTLGGNTIRRGYFINHWFPTHDDEQSRLFTEKYGKTSDLKAPTALAYDAVKILAAAIRHAGSTQHGAVIQSLTSLGQYPGVTGNIAFNSRRDVAKNACIIEIRDGKPHHKRCYFHQKP